MNRIIMLAALSVAFVIGVACGGGGTSSNNDGQPSQNPILKALSSYRPAGGFHIAPGSPKTQIAATPSPSLLFAQSASGTVIGNFEGVCGSIGGPAIPATTWVVFGLGNRTSPNCIQGLPRRGVSIKQDGVLRQFSASVEVGQIPSGTPAKIQFYLFNSNSLVPQPLAVNCTFPVGVNAQVVECSDALTVIPVHAGDRVGAVMMVGDYDSYSGLDVSLQLMTL